MPSDEHSAVPDTSPRTPRLPPVSELTRGSTAARWPLLCLTVILALAAFLRLWQASESLWIDELHTSWVVNGGLSDVLPRAAMGNQSPLYFWGMWLLVQVAGQSEWTLRLPSLLAGIALPAAVYFLVGQVLNLSRSSSEQVENLSFVPLAAALLIALDPTCIFYAQEARPYAWVMLLAVLELVLVKRLIERPTLAWRLAVLVNSLLLFYLHYTTAIFLAGIIVLLPMLVRLTCSPYRTKDLLFDLLIAAVLAAPGVVQMTEIFERRTNWEAFVGKPRWLALVTEVPFTLWALAGAAIVFFAVLVPRLLPGNARNRGSASAATGTALVRSWTTQPSKRSLLWFTVLLATILVPLLLSWIVTRLEVARIFHVRYLVALIPLSAAATCLATAWIRWRAVQLTVLIALCGWHLYNGRMIERFVGEGRLLAGRNEDWRGATKFLNKRMSVSPPELVIVDSDLIEGNRLGMNARPWQVPLALPYLTYAVRGVYRADVDPSLITVSPGIMESGRPRKLWKSPTTRIDLWLLIRGSKDAALRRVDRLNEESKSVVMVSGGRSRLSAAELHEFGNVVVVRIACAFEGR